MTLAAGVLVNQNVRLTRLLGQGGMGAVWVADHLTLRTQVAVKFILEDYTKDAEALERFTREATSAAQIKSPHVVQIFDHGVFSGLPYIVMEFLEGEDLDARLARGPLALGEIAPILQQVGKALTQAHALGIVHRDIKPANVYLASAGEDLLVKLLDFGVAKLTRGGAADPAYKKTQTGQLVGTPCFMSPEQVFSRGAIDFRADLWALAVLVYEAVTCALPFEGNTLGDIYLAINGGVYRPPSALERAFPAALDAWFKRAFERDPAARFGSAREQVDAFLAIAARSPGARRSLPSAGFEAVHAYTAQQPGAHQGTFGGTVSGGATGARKGKVAIAVGAVAGAACAGALALALFGRAPPVTTAAAPTASAAPVPEPSASATATAPAPDVSPAPDAVATASATPTTSPFGSASRPVKSAPPVHAPAHPPGPTKRRDHGF
jgi:serine/threonine-protein kinase